MLVHMLCPLRRLSAVNRKLSTIVVLLLAVAVPGWVPAQRGYTLRVLPTDASPELPARMVSYRTTLPDSAAVTAELTRVVQQLHALGRLEASIDTLLRSDSLFTALLHMGPEFQWMALKAGNVPEDRLKAAGFRPGAFQGKNIQWSQWRKMQETLLQGYENQGFPFAQVGLADVVLDGHQLSAALHAEAGPLVRMGLLEVEGKLRLSNNYLQQFLGIRPGQPYDRSRILRLRQRLRELPFVELKKDPGVVFREDSTASLTLYLEPRKAGRFDFLIGVLPNSAQVGRMLITGTLFADFHNQFGKGERFTASFERLRPETQQLTLQGNLPYVLQLPFSADGRFHLYKRDTTFLNLEYQLGAGYLLEGASYWKAFVHNRITRLLTVDEARLLATRRLPADLDVSLGAFGVETALQRLDYRLNPRRGWSGLLRASAGIKRIRPNNRIVALGLEELYDSLALRSAQYRLEIQAERFVPVGSTATVKLGLQGGYIVSDQPVFRNEQFRIGGNRLLRGFDEEFFFISNYTVATVELRLLIAQNSYLYTFGDLGRLEDRSSERSEVFFPYGFGTGIALETRAGLLGLSLALGARSGTPLDISAPKVHVGYVGLF